METDMRMARGFRLESALLLGALLGGLTSLPVIALSYLGDKFAGLPFFPFDVFDWLARVLPGNVITVGIDSMVRFITSLGLGPISETAKTLEQSMGVVLVIVSGAVLGLVIAFGIQRWHWAGAQVGGILGVVAFVILAAIEVSLKGASAGTLMLGLIWLAILVVAWARLLGGWIQATVTQPSASPQTEGFDASRRDLLIKLAGGSIGVAVVATGLGRLLQAQQVANGAGQSLTSLTNPPAPAPGAPNNGVSSAPTVVLEPTPKPTELALSTTRDRMAAAPGTRPELTPTQDFYRIDVDTLPPEIDKASWKLEVSGLFDNPRTLTLADLVTYPPITQTITQGCISNPVAGDLIGTTNYTGLRLRDLLKVLGLKPQARALAIQGADGFYESVPLEEMMDPRTLLVYGMNGTTLPAEHGFPLRIYIPNHYGMKQPKWITSIQAIDHNGPGYWVDRGWSPTAYPQIVSVIDTVAKDHIDNGMVPVGGIAWAGDRGIQKVEVQVDNGSWREAVIRTPPLSPLTWVQWRYDWPVVRGTRTFRVRATDGTGTLQTDQVQDTYPDGATGYHSVTVTL